MSAPSREASLDSAVGLLRARFGSAAPKPATRPAPRELEPGILPDAVPTGIPAVDALTGVGGLPTGRLSVCIGATGSGKTLLAYRFLASLSEQAAAILWVDLAHQADPWLMARLGARLERVLLVRPPGGGRDLGMALDASLSLVRAGVGGLVVDLPGSTVRSPLWDPMAATLASACARAGIPFVAVGEAAGDPLRYAASVVLRLERRGWVMRHGDVTGVRVTATVEKNKVGVPGRSAEVELDHPLGGFFVPRAQPASPALGEAAPLLEAAR